MPTSLKSDVGTLGMSGIDALVWGQNSMLGLVSGLHRHVMFISDFLEVRGIIWRVDGNAQKWEIPAQTRGSGNPTLHPRSSRWHIWC